MVKGSSRLIGSDKQGIYSDQGKKDFVQCQGKQALKGVDVSVSLIRVKVSSPFIGSR